MTREEVTERLCAWLNAERKRLLRATKKFRVRASIEVTRVVGRFEAESFSLEEDRRMASPLAVREKAAFLWEAAGTAHDSPADLLVSRYGEGCRLWWPGGGFIGPWMYPKAESELAATLNRTLLAWACGEYLCHLGSLDSGDDETAHRIAAAVLDVLEGHEVSVVAFVPLGGITAQGDSVTVEGVTLRSLSPNELGELHGRGFPLQDWGPDPWWSLSQGPPHPGPERTALIMRTQWPKIAQPPESIGERRLVLALQLLGFELCGRGHFTCRAEPPLGFVVRSGRVHLRSEGIPRECTGADLQRALELAGRIPEGVFTTPIRRDEVALHRFMLGAAEDQPGEALIDFVIALESFYLSGSKDELRFRFALHGARYLRQNRDEREALFNGFRDIYDLRSALVHGNEPPSRHELDRGRSQANALAAESLSKALREGWPTPDDFKRAALA